ncbi:sulfate adenylyltransferase subunit CysD [Pseudomonas sp. MSSRFD41]|uniref:sulfate adenylyltransferase subunit CysD n=1 Tax=Pseudomonas sp. MSSRFD41 TaxID=1310370 RepID=UPI00163AA63F|nr:sulfate adenylyltransferase subunit CysD [Pseudomonas sp. MSSRFD41]MBC2655649.1 sulfate adenylyltransferase subunit CysD [Pseudomonas sp. MSSRFD41]
MTQIATEALPELMGLDSMRVWDTELAFAHLKSLGEADTKRTAERRLHSLHLLPESLSEHDLRDEHDRPANPLVLAWAIHQARRRRDRVLFGQIDSFANGRPVLHVNDARGARFWIPLPGTGSEAIHQALDALQHHVDKPIAFFPHGALVGATRAMASTQNVQFCLPAYQGVLSPKQHNDERSAELVHAPWLKRLEAESIYIIREAVAEAKNPVLLYSAGKDSDVMLHLVRKAFYPSTPPLPLLHIDTLWKFQELYLFRDSVARESGMELLVYTNPQALEKHINPFDHGSALHTQITKTEGLKRALDHYRFDVVLGGARRDEEKSRAKERIFSPRPASHQWDPQGQRPELWNLYNSRKASGTSIRVFPLSNWTELDIWRYIHQENIDVAPLYFAKPRPVVMRPEMIMVVDDGRCRLLPDEKIQIRTVRFRSLGCYPLTGALESDAETPQAIIRELMHSHRSERHARIIDTDSPGSMEQKKREGYF